MDQRESPDIIEQALTAEPIENAEASEPTEPMDRIEPAEPMDRIEPAEPIDKIEPLDPMLRIEPAEPVSPGTPCLVRMRTFSQPERAAWSLDTGLRAMDTSLCDKAGAAGRAGR